MKKLIDTHEIKTSTLIVAISQPQNPLSAIDSYIEEFRNLVESSGHTYQHELFIKLRQIDPGTFVTKGKLQELIDLCVQKKIDEVIVSEALSWSQERSLSKLLNCTVIDRTRLILDIFERRALSAEGKMQVALAKMQYAKARLAGRGVSMSQQSGHIGGRGPGETSKEIEMQHIERMITTLRKDLARLAQVRSTQRKQRLSSNMPMFCLVGYTNAGKSTILNTLTKSDVLVENRLFSTLDTTTRELYLSGKKILLSDTVGFIQQLPHHLIEAFKSTLTELEYATLLLQVVDVSDPNWQDHCTVVKNVLEELDIQKPMLYVFNKSDKVANLQELEPKLASYQPHVIVSATSPEGLEPLVAFLNTWDPKKTAP